VQGLVIGFLK